MDSHGSLARQVVGPRLRRPLLGGIVKSPLAVTDDHGRAEWMTIMRARERFPGVNLRERSPLRADGLSGSRQDSAAFGEMRRCRLDGQENAAHVDVQHEVEFPQADGLKITPSLDTIVRTEVQTTVLKAHRDFRRWATNRA